MSYPQFPFKMSDITIQPQAKLCMQKLHITEEEVLTTMNEWESGDVTATDPITANQFAAFPELENEIPALYEQQRDFPERNLTIVVTYSTTIKTRQGKRKICAHIHWVSTQLPLTLIHSPTELETFGDWLEPMKQPVN